ncbi:hypothetical protein RF55_15590 [Lasius niger]|uniref:Uncharacterized protein n=1 Tax=Lasius niger TaxID=67767 RepID=A0A0J7K5R9_LASNI|nr:hypothetical protein RF55_15590 [Lasius niger]
MFRQINVYPDDWDLQRILWVDDQLNITSYQLTIATYGTRPAPFLAVQVLLQLVEDEGINYSLAVALLTKGRYVDDIYGGADNLKKLTFTALQLVDLCKTGGFPLAKWQSNHSDLLKTLSPDNTSTESHIFENVHGKILGLTWHPQSDRFIFFTKASPRHHYQTDNTLRSSPTF